MVEMRGVLTQSRKAAKSPQRELEKLFAFFDWSDLCALASWREILSALLVLLTLSGCAAQQGRQPTSGEAFKAARLEMVQTQLMGRDVHDRDVLLAMRNVPRHRFVPPQLHRQAYADHPLPIGYDQTISQPYIVALMTQTLQLKRGQKVLEVGTGSGYQAAVLAEMGLQVFSIEIIPELAERAAKTLRELGYEDVQVRHGDGYLGWEEEAPFDAIIVTAAPEHLPQPLADQLAEGGRLIIPVGPVFGVQSLLLYEKKGGELKETYLFPVRFVPLTRRPNPEG